MKGKDKLEVWNQMIENAHEGRERWPATEVIQQGRTTLIFGK